MCQPLRSTVLLLATLLVALPTACISVPRTIARVTPQRPALSPNTATTAPGTYEVEGGIAADDDGNVDTPMLVKYGFDPRTEVFLGVSPLRVADRPGGDERGVGDVSFGLRTRVREARAHVPGVAVQFKVKLPVADEDQGLGTGETDVYFAGIAEQQIEEWDVVGFYQLGFLGTQGDGGVDIGHDLALFGARPLRSDLALFGELAGHLVPQTDTSTVVTTWGVAYTLHPAIVLDVGLTLGVTNDAPDATLVFGFTRNLGRLTRYPSR